MVLFTIMSLWQIGLGVSAIVMLTGSMTRDDKIMLGVLFGSAGIILMDETSFVIGVPWESKEKKPKEYNGF